MTFSYMDGENYVFMDDTTFENIEIHSSKIE
jgi:translation elongation factor P/translation initiation factor 5A